MSINVIVQARMSSRRLPGKVLMGVPGKEYSIIELILNRLKCSSKINKIIVATTEEDSDDELASIVESNGFDVVRGDLNDVLSRYLKAVSIFESDHIVRVTADCPLIDPELIDKLIEEHIVCDNDYTSLALDPTYPDGLDAEIIKTEVLKSLSEFNLSNTDKEHVTYHIYTNPSEFKIGSFKDSEDYSFIRLTIDEHLDYDFFKEFINDIEVDPLMIRYQDIKNFIKTKEIDYFTNTIIKRNEGLYESIKKDH